MNKNKKNPLLKLELGNVLFPGIKSTLEIEEPEALKAVDAAIEENDGRIIAGIKSLKSESGLEKYGVLAIVSIMKKWSDGTATISVDSTQRVEIINVENNDNLYSVAEYKDVQTVDLNEEQISEIKIKASRLANLVGEFGETLKTIVESDDVNIESISNAIDEIYVKLAINDKDVANKLLQENNPLKKLDTLTKLISNTYDASEVENDINKKMKNRIDEQQKEFYLREKLKAIKDELNDGSSDDNSIENYKKRLEEEPFPKHVKEKILSEISKLETMQPSSAEGNIQRTYVDWMMSLPWWEKTEDIKDLDFAKKVLDEHHYGLKKIKERIIEHLAVKQKTDSVKGQIITLVGPPGVGKTSLAKSIAEAMGRNFVKVSLGGIKDEAEIRGHRRTYVGAMPGRIVQSMKRAKVKNPLFLLDEIDKMASDYKGDPASAMLEVLDPEQNSEFSDHYIEEAYDLGDVMFIATANYPEDIPEALYDRMEIINLSSYTEIEKLKIAENYLLPKVMKEYNLQNNELTFTKESLEEIIKHYTREAGVRQLERWISSIARKFLVKELTGEIKTLNVTPEIVNEYLGKRIFDHTSKQETAQIGVVTGLAYTQFGGDILPIEVNYFPGKGGLVLTGKLGDVMKESATIALDYVKSNYKEFGIDSEIFENNDIHIHVPEGAVPKDGPSAGITLTTAIISALTGKPVSENIGMTGEITLRGHVLPIGGLREKSISAARSGLKKILIPFENQKDIEDIPEEVQAVLEIKPVKEYEQVFKEIFENN